MGKYLVLIYLEYRHRGLREVSARLTEEDAIELDESCTEPSCRLTDITLILIRPIRAY